MEVTWAIIEEALAKLKALRPGLDDLGFNELISTVRLRALAREPLEIGDLVKLADNLVNLGIEKHEKSGAMNYGHD